MKVVAPLSRRRIVTRTFFLMATGLLLMGEKLLAFEAVSTIRDVDVERGVLHIYANGQDRVVRIAKDIRGWGTDGKPLADGLMSKELKKGVEVRISLGKGD